MEEKLLGNN